MARLHRLCPTSKDLWGGERGQTMPVRISVSILVDRYQVRMNSTRITLVAKGAMKETGRFGHLKPQGLIGIFFSQGH